MLTSTDADTPACLEWGEHPPWETRAIVMWERMLIFLFSPGSISPPPPQLCWGLVLVRSPKPVSGILSTLSCQGAAPAMLPCVPRAPELGDRWQTAEKLWTVIAAQGRGGRNLSLVPEHRVPCCPSSLLEQQTLLWMFFRENSTLCPAHSCQQLGWLQGHC